MPKPCIRCGHELREADKFCSECGTYVGGPTAHAEVPEWEYCEIVFEAELVKPLGLIRSAGVDYTFWASGLGTRGFFLVPTSPHRVRQYQYGPGFFQSVYGDVLPYPECREAVKALVVELTAQRWERLPTDGPKWFNHTFRRPVSR